MYLRIFILTGVEIFSYRLNCFQEYEVAAY
jgi:hypothetical protein